MSYHVMDYLPFDYNHYIGEILPLLQQAQEGDLHPLLHLVRSAHSFSLWPLFNEPLPFSKRRLEAFRYHKFAVLKETLSMYAHDPRQETENIDPWPILEKVLPTLLGKPLDSDDEDSAALLCLCLLYTFCCDLPEKAKRSVVIFEHEEPAYYWMDYIARDEETKALWAAFRQLPPAPLATLFSTSTTHEGYVFGDEYSPRKLDIYGRRYATPTGFITPQEAVNLLAYAERLHEEPVLSTILGGCIRDAQNPTPWRSSPLKVPTVDQERIGVEGSENEEAFGVLPSYSRRLYEQWMRERPAELTQLMHRYYRQLWEAEDEIMLRLRYAVACGWGMLEVYD